MNKKTQDEVLTEIKEYSSKMSQVQKNLIKYLDEEVNDDANYQNLIQSLTDQKIIKDNHKMREFLHLIAELSIYHHRSSNFFNKIEKIIKNNRDNISKSISNEELFNIFIKNNRIILFLFKENVIKPEFNSILRILNFENSETIQKCFSIPNDPFSDRSKNHQISINAEIIEKEIEKFGENDNDLCEIIRKDSIDDFIASKTDVNFQIQTSIYETNQFLKDKTPSIIEYSAFYGSLNIFKYVLSKNALFDENLWQYAIHGRNLEILREIEKTGIDPPYRSFEEPANELIKCHHNELADYIINEKLNNEELNEDDQNLVNFHLMKNSVDSYNFEMIPQRFVVDFDKNKINYFLYTCYNDYFYIIQLLLGLEEIDVNSQTIFFFFFNC